MTRLHLSLNVHDLDRPVRFYAPFLGLPPHKIRPGNANFDVTERPGLIRAARLFIRRSKDGHCPGLLRGVRS